MIYTTDNSPPGAVCIDADTGVQIRYVISVNTADGEVFCYDKAGEPCHGQSPTKTHRFASIRQVEDPRYPLAFHCFGRIDGSAVDIELLPLEHVADTWAAPGRYCVGVISGVDYSTPTRTDAPSERRDISSVRDATMKIVCAAVAREVSDKTAKAFQDHAATFAHYMCAEPIKPAVVIIETPKAKPALAGLGITTGDRYTGRLTEE